jgi:hypothetical protein
MTGAEAATLTGALLVTKGQALPAPECVTIVPGGNDVTDVDERFVVLATGNRIDARPNKANRSPREPVSRPLRVKASVKLNPDLHRRLRLATTHLGQSMQDFLVTAAERYLSQVQPALRNGQCACIAQDMSDAQEAPRARKTA